MARAFVVRLRNDLETGSLRALDLKPNASLQNTTYTTQKGQTSALCGSPYATPVELVDVGAGSMQVVNDAYGMQALLLDAASIDGNAATLNQVALISDAVLSRVSSGLSMTGFDFYLAVIDVLGPVNLGGVADISYILRVLSGEVYKLPAGTLISGAGNVFSGVLSGFFVTAPTVVRASSAGGPGGTPSGVLPLFRTRNVSPEEADGRLLGAGVTLNVASTADENFQDIRILADTPDLHRSCAQGALSVLKSSTFLFNNPSFTYGVGGTARTLIGDTIAATGTSAYRSAAVVVYDDQGNLI